MAVSGGQMSTSLELKIDTADGINVRTETDKNNCHITGSTMMKGDTTLAIVDWENCSVKLVDIKQKSVVYQIAMPSKPWDITPVQPDQLAVTKPLDITQVQPDQLAVTLPNAHKIQFLTVNGTSMSLGRHLDVSGECYGIVHNNGKLIVGFCDPGKIQTLSMSCRVIDTIKPRTHGRPYLEKPLYITVSADQSLMYINDRSFDNDPSFDINDPSLNNIVYCLKMDGSVKAKYKDPGLKNPYGVSAVVKDGSVIVCGRESDNMYVISADCTQGTVLVDKTCGLIKPTSVTYSSGLSTLYVGQAHHDTLKVFKLK